MLRIPYVPKAYPDEMFASLLTRLVLYNGTGLWRSLLEETGYGRRAISPFFGPPMQDAKLDGLLSALGYTYTGMLRELTILPFWLAFNEATEVRSKVRIDKAAGRLTELTRLGHTQFLPGARYCPSCLQEDIATYGEPYVHRNHQLPVATVCARHGAVLRFACPTCGITVMPFNRSLLRPPALQCQCGQDLSLTSTAPPHQQALLQLSRFAADSLSCTEAPWTAGQIQTVLQARTGITRGNFRRRAVQLLQEAYGKQDEAGYEGRTLLRLGETGSSMRLKIGTSRGQLRAPEYCALLAAAGLSFEEFKEAVNQVEATATRKISMPRRALTIEQARQEFERFEAQMPGRAAKQLRNSSPGLFWLLRLQDGALMQAHGYCYDGAIPTVDADRATIDHRRRQHGHIAKSGGAWIRASIRDDVWLQAQTQAQTAIPRTAENLAQHVQRERALALSRAVFSLLRTQARPARVHAGSLAKVIQISMHQAQHTIANTPALKALIDAVNAGKNRRLAFWAARGLIEEGQSPSPKDVLRRAGLNTTQVHRQFCIDAIACFAADRSYSSEG